MAEEVNEASTAPSVPPAAAHAEADLSAEINAHVETHMGETVRCVRVYGDNYRCNWWGKDATVPGDRLSPGFEVSEMRVRRSSFLKVKKTAGGLQIQDLTLLLAGRAR